MLELTAMIYAVALCFTALVAWGLGGTARLRGALLLASAWMGTIAAQSMTQDVAPLIVYALMDFALVLLFGVIALLHNRDWAWWVSGFHVAMLILHMTYHLTGEANTYIYLSVLAGLGYASMIAIAGPPIWQRMRGGRHDSVGLGEFMRGRSLPPSFFESSTVAEEGQKRCP